MYSTLVPALLAAAGLAAPLSPQAAAPSPRAATAPVHDECALPESAPPSLADELSPDEWAQVRALHAAERHAVRALVEDDPTAGHVARNPGQAWTTTFDGRGFTSRPDHGRWTWGLELRRYGFPGATRPADAAAATDVDGGRLTWTRDDAVAEWFVNDRRGLEHGFTLAARPAGGDGDVLAFRFAVRGELFPVVRDAGRSVRFVEPSGATGLVYGGLVAFDAEGRDLSASMRRDGRDLLLEVDVGGAAYPVTIDPLAQQAYLKPFELPALHDHFGRSVSLSGDTLVIGSYGEDSMATGVNGDETDNSVLSSGAAYVYVRSRGVWTQQAYLKASNTDEADTLGRSVSIDGDTIVVGAYGEDSNATGVDGNQGDESASNAGAAYVYVRNAGVWSQQAYLKASNTDAGDLFGHSVAVSGDTIVVSAELESSNATGVNGNEADNSANAAGAAYVFVRNASVWSQQAYLKASNTDADDRFGWPVAIDGDTIVVGSQNEESNAAGVGGNEADDSLNQAGAAYVFVRDTGVWSQQAYLKASTPDAGDLFGWSVAVSGDTILVGARDEESSATGVNGNDADDSAPNAGAVYVFTRSGTTWTPQAYLKASNTDADDTFGFAVALDGDRAVVGARAEGSNATGVDGNQGSNTLFQAGAVYLFERVGTTWTQEHYIKASNTDWNDVFGIAVEIDGTTVVAGAIHESSDATGSGGDQFNDNVFHAGATYVFDDLPDPWTDLGCATTGTHGPPLLVGSGALAPGSPGAMDLTNVVGGRPAFMVVSFAEGSTPIFGGTLKPAVPWNAEFLFVIPGALDSNSSLNLPWAAFPTLPSGFEMVFQYLIEDPGHFSGVALSNSVKGVVP